MNSAANQTSNNADDDPLTDKQLMEGIVEGDQNAFDELYKRYGKTVYAVCMRVLKKTNEADEVTHQIFWEVWEKADRFDPERGSVQAFVLTIARSRAVDKVRSRNSKSGSANQVHLDAVPMLTVDGFDPSSQMQIEEMQVVVRRAIASLDEAQREAIELAFYERLTHVEIAKRLKKPLGTIKAHIRKGLMKLGTCLAEFEKGR